MLMSFVLILNFEILLQLVSKRRGWCKKIWMNDSYTIDLHIIRFVIYWTSNKTLHAEKNKKQLLLERNASSDCGYLVWCSNSEAIADVEFRGRQSNSEKIMRSHEKPVLSFLTVLYFQMNNAKISH